MSKLKQLREAQHLTQEELAEKARISVRTIQRIEAGTEPKGHTLKTLAQILNVAERELVSLPAMEQHTQVVPVTDPVAVVKEAVAERELVSQPAMEQHTEVSDVTEPVVEVNETVAARELQQLKLLNLSSILFVVLPPLNIAAPWLLAYFLKQKNPIARQLVSVQILWTILAPIVFMMGILLKPGNRFTLVLMAAIVLSNVYLILRNAYELDRYHKLRYKLNFNLL